MYENYLTITMPTQTAGDPADHDVALPAYPCQLVGATFCPSAASAADASNYGSIVIEHGTGSSTTFTTASDVLTTATVAMVVGTVRDFTPNGATLPAGGIVRIAKTATGTGVAVAGVVTLRLKAV